MLLRLPRARAHHSRPVRRVQLLPRDGRACLPRRCRCTPRHRDLECSILGRILREATASSSSKAPSPSSRKRSRTCRKACSLTCFHRIQRVGPLRVTVTLPLSFAFRCPICSCTSTCARSRRASKSFDACGPRRRSRATTSTSGRRSTLAPRAPARGSRCHGATSLISHGRTAI